MMLHGEEVYIIPDVAFYALNCVWCPSNHQTERMEGNWRQRTFICRI